MWQVATRSFPAYPWKLAQASFGEVRAMLRPALSFLLFPLSYALVIQGMSLVVGTTLGPAALAVFNTCRTLSRLPIQMLMTLSGALWPEISRGFGDENLALLRRIYNRGTMLSLVLCAAACVVVFVSAPWVLEFWTRSRIAIEPALLALFLAVAFANCSWQVAQVMLIATNRHERLATIYLFAAVLSVAAAIAMPASWGLYGILVAAGLFEIILLFASRRLVAGLLRKG
jgi:O-antigen/teichoic acid export membrane protein